MTDPLGHPDMFRYFCFNGSCQDKNDSNPENAKKSSGSYLCAQFLNRLSLNYILYLVIVIRTIFGTSAIFTFATDMIAITVDFGRAPSHVILVKDRTATVGFAFKLERKDTFPSDISCWVTSDSYARMI